VKEVPDNKFKNRAPARGISPLGEGGPRTLILLNEEKKVGGKPRESPTMTQQELETFNLCLAWCVWFSRVGLNREDWQRCTGGEKWVYIETNAQIGKVFQEQGSSWVLWNRVAGRGGRPSTTKEKIRRVR